jgi:hypothetical protein
VYVLRFGLALRELPAGPRIAIKRYRQICGFPGDPDYLLLRPSELESVGTSPFRSPWIGRTGFTVCGARKFQEPCPRLRASNKARRGPAVLPRCQTTNKSHVASFSAIGTMTTFGVSR